jgi:hypothetical protein
VLDGVVQLFQLFEIDTLRSIAVRAGGMWYFMDGQLVL